MSRLIELCDRSDPTNDAVAIADGAKPVMYAGYKISSLSDIERIRKDHKEEARKWDEAMRLYCGEWK